MRRGPQIGEKPEAECRSLAPHCGDFESDACRAEPEASAGDPVLVYCLVWIQVRVLKKEIQSTPPHSA